MTLKALVNGYLDAFYKGDFDTAGTFLSEDFKFKGPFVEASNKMDYFKSAGGLSSIVRGHKVLRQWEDGGEVSSIHEVRLETPSGSGSIVMSEWYVVRDGKLVSGRVILDTGAFRAIVPPTK